MKETEILEIRCERCSGTGLYQSNETLGRSAIICNECKGSGMVEFKYIPFTEKIKRNDIKRVFQKTCGRKHSHKDYTDQNGVFREFSKGGCTYEEWLNGKTPKPVKELYCPRQWTNNKGLPKTLFKCSELRLTSHKNCPIYEHKANCWINYEYQLKKEKNNLYDLIQAKNINF